jgi:hypothetical protein
LGCLGFLLIFSQSLTSIEKTLIGPSCQDVIARLNCWYKQVPYESKTLKDGIVTTIFSCDVRTLGSQAPLNTAKAQSHSYLVACIKSDVSTVRVSFLWWPFEVLFSKTLGEHYDDELVFVAVEFLALL